MVRRIPLSPVANRCNRMSQLQTKENQGTESFLLLIADICVQCDELKSESLLFIPCYLVLMCALFM